MKLLSKGLVQAINETLPNVHEAFCTQHIRANIEKDFGKEAGIIFASCVTKPTKAQFEVGMKGFNRLAKGRLIKTYVRKIPSEMWANHAFPQRRWGHTTSNIVEIINGVLSSNGARQLSPLKLLHHIWEYQQRLFAERAEDAQGLQTHLAKESNAHLNRILQDARGWDVIPARFDPDLMEGTVRSHNHLINGRLEEHVSKVNLGDRDMTCTCGRPQDEYRPCMVSSLSVCLAAVTKELQYQS
jgi:hypothetical protein